eukprot:g10596.t1
MKGRKRRTVDVEDRVPTDDSLKSLRRPARLNPFLPSVAEETEEEVADALGDDFPYPSARDVGKATSLLGQTWKQRLASLPPSGVAGALGLGFSFLSKHTGSIAFADFDPTLKNYDDTEEEAYLGYLVGEIDQDFEDLLPVFAFRRLQSSGSYHSRAGVSQTPSVLGSTFHHGGRASLLSPNVQNLFDKDQLRVGTTSGVGRRTGTSEAEGSEAEDEVYAAYRLEQDRLWKAGLLQFHEHLQKLLNSPRHRERSLVAKYFFLMMRAPEEARGGNAEVLLEQLLRFLKAVGEQLNENLKSSPVPHIFTTLLSHANTTRMCLKALPLFFRLAKRAVEELKISAADVVPDIHLQPQPLPRGQWHGFLVALAVGTAALCHHPETREKLLTEKDANLDHIAELLAYTTHHHPFAQRFLAAAVTALTSPVSGSASNCTSQRTSTFLLTIARCLLHKEECGSPGGGVTGGERNLGGEVWLSAALANLACDKMNVKTILASDIVHAGLHRLVTMPGVAGGQEEDDNPAQQPGAAKQAGRKKSRKSVAANSAGTSVVTAHQQQNGNGKVLSEQTSSTSGGDSSSATNNDHAALRKKTDLEGGAAVLLRRLHRNCAWTLVNVARNSLQTSQLLPMVRAALLLLHSVRASNRHHLLAKTSARSGAARSPRSQCWRGKLAAVRAAARIGRKPKAPRESTAANPGERSDQSGGTNNYTKGSSLRWKKAVSVVSQLMKTTTDDEAPSVQEAAPSSSCSRKHHSQLQEELDAYAEVTHLLNLAFAQWTGLESLGDGGESTTGTRMGDTSYEKLDSYVQQFLLRNEIKEHAAQTVLHRVLSEADFKRECGKEEEQEEENPSDHGAPSTTRRRIYAALLHATAVGSEEVKRDALSLLQLYFTLDAGECISLGGLDALILIGGLKVKSPETQQLCVVCLLQLAIGGRWGSFMCLIGHLEPVSVLLLLTNSADATVRKMAVLALWCLSQQELEVVQDCGVDAAGKTTLTKGMGSRKIEWDACCFAQVPPNQIEEFLWKRMEPLLQNFEAKYGYDHADRRRSSVTLTPTKKSDEKNDDNSPASGELVLHPQQDIDMRPRDMSVIEEGEDGSGTSGSEEQEDEVDLVLDEGRCLLQVRKLLEKDRWLELPFVSRVCLLECLLTLQHTELAHIHLSLHESWQRVFDAFLDMGNVAAGAGGEGGNVGGGRGFGTFFPPTVSPAVSHETMPKSTPSDLPPFPRLTAELLALARHYFPPDEAGASPCGLPNEGSKTTPLEKLISPCFGVCSARTFVEVVRSTRGYLSRKFPQEHDDRGHEVVDSATSSEVLPSVDAVDAEDEDERGIDRIDLAIQAVHVLGTLCEIRDVCRFLATPKVLNDVTAFCQTVRGFLKQTAEKMGEGGHWGEEEGEMGGEISSEINVGAQSSLGKSLVRRRTFRATLSSAQPIKSGNNYLNSTSDVTECQDESTTPPGRFNSNYRLDHGSRSEDGSEEASSLEASSGTSSSSGSSAEQLSGLRLQEKLWCILLRVASLRSDMITEHTRTFLGLFAYLSQSDILCESSLRDPVLTLWKKAVGTGSSIFPSPLLQASSSLFEDLLWHGIKFGDLELVIHLCTSVLEQTDLLSTMLGFCLLDEEVSPSDEALSEHGAGAPAAAIRLICTRTSASGLRFLNSLLSEQESCPIERISRETQRAALTGLRRMNSTNLPEKENINNPVCTSWYAEIFGSAEVRDGVLRRMVDLELRGHPPTTTTATEAVAVEAALLLSEGINFSLSTSAASNAQVHDEVYALLVDLSAALCACLALGWLFYPEQETISPEQLLLQGGEEADHDNRHEYGELKIIPSLVSLLGDAPAEAAFALGLNRVLQTLSFHGACRKALISTNLPLVKVVYAVASGSELGSFDLLAKTLTTIGLLTANDTEAEGILLKAASTGISEINLVKEIVRIAYSRSLVPGFVAETAKWVLQGFTDSTVDYFENGGGRDERVRTTSWEDENLLRLGGPTSPGTRGVGPGTGDPSGAASTGLVVGHQISHNAVGEDTRETSTSTSAPAAHAPPPPTLLASSSATPLPGRKTKAGVRFNASEKMIDEEEEDQLFSREHDLVPLSLSSDTSREAATKIKKRATAHPGMTGDHLTGGREMNAGVEGTRRERGETSAADGDRETLGAGSETQQPKPPQTQADEASTTGQQRDGLGFAIGFENNQYAKKQFTLRFE